MIAIYARKSVSTETGDSINNQILICKEYILQNNTDITDTDFKIYQDEGYSGKNTDRPMFKIMMNDIENGLIDTIVCYRLDRISRSLADFSKWIDKLSYHNVNFISIKESFDLSSPIGRAMAHIASVFSQLERETISERVKDNAIELAKSGRWLGGKPPFGYKVVSSTYIDKNGNTKKCKYLALDNGSKEYEYICEIFNAYKEGNSIPYVKKYCINNDVLTPNGIIPTFKVIHDTLINPVYVAGDLDVYNFLLSNNCNITLDKSLFTGEYGLIAYGKRAQSNSSCQKNTKFNDWIFAIGKHKPIISGKEWISIMTSYHRNNTNDSKSTNPINDIFINLIKCKCGSHVNYIKYKHTSKCNITTSNHYYFCPTRTRSYGKLCDNKNINGNLFYNTIIDKIDYILHSYVKDKNLINNKIKEIKNKILLAKNNISLISNEINIIQSKIDIIFCNTTNNNFSLVSKNQIEIVIEDLNQKIIYYKNKLDNLKNDVVLLNNELKNMENKEKLIYNFKDTFNSYSYYQKKEIINSIIYRIDYLSYNNFNIVINPHFINSKNKIH